MVPRANGSSRSVALSISPTISLIFTATIQTLRSIGAASYMGMPLLDLDGKVLGHLAVLDLRPMPSEPRAQALFQIFTARAAAELRRLRAEAQVREREAEVRPADQQRHGRHRRSRSELQDHPVELGGGKNFRLRDRGSHRRELHTLPGARRARETRPAGHRPGHATGRAAVDLDSGRAEGGDRERRGVCRRSDAVPLRRGARARIIRWCSET